MLQAIPQKSEKELSHSDNISSRNVIKPIAYLSDSIAVLYSSE